LTKLIIFQELRRKIADLDQQLAEVYPERIVRRRQVFEQLGKLLREEINLLDPQEQQLRLAVLGQVLEALIREEEGKQTGTFYTSQTVVTLMCRLALWNYLGQKSHLHGFSWGHLGRLIFAGELISAGEFITKSGDSENNSTEIDVTKSCVDPNHLDHRERGKAVLLDLVRQVRIIDPAVGSGAFLLGMLDELTALRLVLGDNLNTLTIRRQVIEANLFGVDSEAAAIEVVKLRLSLGSGVTSRMVCEDSLFLDWAKYFPEVMAEGGFDIFLANPPYVSQDRLQKSYKDRLVAAYSSQHWPVDRKTDLYAYFYALGVRTLRPNGTAVLISSTAWLDVEYGAWLQKFLLANFQLPLIMDSSVERWFGAAAVNTAIIVLNRASISTGESGSIITAFLTLRQSLTPSNNQSENQSENQSGQIAQQTYAADELLEELTIIFNGCARNQENSCLRVNALAASQLGNWQNPRLAPVDGGKASAELGGKWGKYLRAPRVYFQLYNYAREKLCCLGDITTLKRGFTTGCNEFFYLKAGQQKNGQQALVEPKYLKPVIKSPKETLGYVVNGEKLKIQVLLIHEAEHCWGKGTSNYIKWGESQSYHTRLSLAVRNPWWQLTKKHFPALIFRRFFYEKFNIPYLATEIAEDQTFYGIYYSGDPLILAAILNSTLTWLFIELHGRTALGEGILQYAVYEAARLPILNPDCLGVVAQQRLREVFQQLANRPVLDLELELASPDRILLDAILLQALGITGQEERDSLQDNLYRDFFQLVRNRLGKAKN
jgi:hypothetical protein